MAGMPTLPGMVIYLVLLLAEGLGLELPLSAEYLQDGSPAFTITVVEDGADDLFRITAEPLASAKGPDVGDSAGGQPAAEQLPGERPTGEGPLGESRPVVIRVEESDLLGHTYLVHEPASTGPRLIELAGVLEQFTTVNSPSIRTISLGELAGSGGPGSGEVGAEAQAGGPQPAATVRSGGLVHIARRGGALIVTNPASGITLFVVGE